jgi:hypothetical protein
MRTGTAAIAVVGLALTVSALATPLFAEPPRLRPGQYEIQTALTMPGRASAAPRTKVQCVTAEDIKDFSRRFGTRPQQEPCTMADYKQSSSAVSYTQTCAVPDGSRVTMKANFTFPSDETFRALVETSSTGGQAAAASPLYRGSTITITAKRIGECRK